jgi:transcription elongation GreA/GreB family factor
MTTPRKPGAREDNTALAEARRHVEAAASTADRMIDRIETMRESVGRPDYGQLERLVALLSTHLRRAVTQLWEMERIRLEAGGRASSDLGKRVAELEAKVNQLIEEKENG